MPDPEGLTAAAAASVQCDKTGLDHSDDPSRNPDVCPGVKNDQKAELKQFLAQEEKLVWKVTHVPFSGTAMWLWLCSTNSTAEQLAQKCLKKYLFLSTEK